MSHRGKPPLSHARSQLPRPSVHERSPDPPHAKDVPTGPLSSVSAHRASPRVSLRSLLSPAELATPSSSGAAGCPAPDQVGSGPRPASRSPSLSQGCRVTAGRAGRAEHPQRVVNAWEPERRFAFISLRGTFLKHRLAAGGRGHNGASRPGLRPAGQLLLIPGVDDAGTCLGAVETQRQCTPSRGWLPATVPPPPRD